jgi:hypothetical protein
VSLQRNLYLASRLAGDVRAVQRGRLPARYANRYRHRAIIRFLRALGLW